MFVRQALKNNIVQEVAKKVEKDISIPFVLRKRGGEKLYCLAKTNTTFHQCTSIISQKGVKMTFINLADQKHPPIIFQLSREQYLPINWK